VVCLNTRNEENQSRALLVLDWHIKMIFFLLIGLIRDVAAGIAILLEAGGLVTTANPPENIESDPIEDVRLGSRLYLAIR